MAVNINTQPNVRSSNVISLEFTAKVKIHPRVHPRVHQRVHHESEEVDSATKAQRPAMIMKSNVFNYMKAEFCSTNEVSIIQDSFQGSHEDV